MLQLPIQREQWHQLWVKFQSRRWLLYGPVLLFTLLGTGAALLRSPEWQASQTIVVRDESIGGSGRLGQFESTEKLKAFQETVLEVARSQAVVVQALKIIGPTKSLFRNTAHWPTIKDIERFQQKIKVGAPRGTELGKTEVLYLSVDGDSPADAQKRATIVYEILEQRLSELRNARATSLVEEHERTLVLAQAELDQSNAALKQMETEVGTDLSDLRALAENGTGDGSLKTLLNQLRTELRSAETQMEALQDLRTQLETAKSNPALLVVTPVKLLESQPALKKLREGLVAAQLKTAELLGNRSEAHPEVVAARRAEQRVRDDMYAELANAIRGLDAELTVTETQISSLKRQLEDTRTHLDRLASMRAPYSSLVADVRQREMIVEAAKKSLSDARARQSAANSTSLLTRLEAPVVGEHPIGPTKRVLIGGGLFGGFAIGSALVILAWPSQSNQRRWSDLLNMGRRATDRIMGQTLGRGRRTSDTPPADTAGAAANPIPAVGRRASDPVIPAQRRASDAPPFGRRVTDASELNPPVETGSDRRSQRDTQ